MPVSSKRVEGAGEDRADFLGRLFAAIDAMDTDAFIAMLTPDAEFQFGNAPPVQTRNLIGESVDGFFSTIAGLRHDLHNVVDNGPLLACEGSVTYTRHDGTTVTLPFADVFEFDGDLIAGYRIYMDIGPVYTAAS
jgi:ketosteroid isomerase-like protein